MLEQFLDGVHKLNLMAGAAWKWVNARPRWQKVVGVFLVGWLFGAIVCA